MRAGDRNCEPLCENGKSAHAFRDPTRRLAWADLWKARIAVSRRGYPLASTTTSPRIIRFAWSTLSLMSYEYVRRAWFEEQFRARAATTRGGHWPVRGDRVHEIPAEAPLTRPPQRERRSRPHGTGSCARHAPTIRSAIARRWAHRRVLGRHQDLRAHPTAAQPVCAFPPPAGVGARRKCRRHRAPVRAHLDPASGSDCVSAASPPRSQVRHPHHRNR